MDKDVIILRFQVHRIGTGSQSINGLTTLPLSIIPSNQAGCHKPVKHEYIFLIPVRVK